MLRIVLLLLVEHIKHFQFQISVFLEYGAASLDVWCPTF